MGTAYKNADSSLQSQINTLNSKYTTVQNGITDLGKSVANGKNLIGGVVGGNSSSTFATLANNVQTIKNQRDNYSSRLSNSLNLETIYIGSSGLTIRSSYTSFPILFIGGSSNSAYDMKLFFYAYEYGGYKRFVRREDDHYTWGITYNDYTFADKRAYPIPYYGTSVNYSKIRYSVSVSNDIITLTITPYDSKYIQNYTRILYYK